MSYLPNGCSTGKMSVHPKNWLQAGASVNITWYIHYMFYDPKFRDHPKYKYGYPRIVKGMNSEKTLEKRRAATKIIIADEIELLKEGFNPITGKTFEPIALAFDLSPQTPFIKALWKAFDKITVVPNYRLGIKSVIRRVEKSAKELNIESVPVSKITRKYIKVLLEKCKLKSARSHNYYRTALIILFKELIQMEAVDINPVKDISVMKETRKERIELTREERTLIVQNLSEKQYPLLRAIQIFFASGARETELMNVQGKHVDLINQSCKYTVRKGPDIREVRRPIKDIVLPLWEELMLTCRQEDYLFSTGLVPGQKKIRPEQFSRRWKRHVKNKMNIKAGLYSLKHSHTTEIVDALSEIEAAKLNAHSEAMVIKIYDTKNKKRKDDSIKKVWNAF